MTTIETPGVETTPMVGGQIRATVADLKAAWARVNPYIAVRGMLPVLSGVLVTADDTEITVTATDLDMGARFPVPGNPVEPLRAVVPYAPFKKFLASRDKADVVSLTTASTAANDGIDLVVTVGSTNLRLRCAPDDEYPRLPALDCGESGFPIDVSAMAEVAAVASREDNRPILGGVLVEADTVVATDSYRLHIVEGAFSWPGDPVLVPHRVVLDAAKHGATHMVLTDDERTVLFRTPDGGVITGRVIEGEFPNWRGLVPASSPVMFRVPDPTAVPKAVKELAWLLADSTPVRLCFADGVPSLAAVAQDVGLSTTPAALEFVAGIPVDDETGAPSDQIVAAFNPTYFAALFDGLADGATFEGLDHLKPWVASAPRPVGGVSRRLLMPVRVS